MKLQKTILLSIEDNTYTIKFPTIGQLMDIENMRMALTNGAYSEMSRSRAKSSVFIIDTVDMISCFFVLIPELRKDLLVKSYAELDPFKSKKLLKVYNDIFYPWYEGWLTELYKEDEDLKPEDSDAADEQPELN